MGREGWREGRREGADVRAEVRREAEEFRAAERERAANKQASTVGVSLGDAVEIGLVFRDAIRDGHVVVVGLGRHRQAPGEGPRHGSRGATVAVIRGVRENGASNRQHHRGPSSSCLTLQPGPPRYRLTLGSVKQSRCAATKEEAPSLQPHAPAAPHPATSLQVQRRKQQIKAL